MILTCKRWTIPDSKDNGQLESQKETQITYKI
jgi:hypothetical protein